MNSTWDSVTLVRYPSFQLRSGPKDGNLASLLAMSAYYRAPLGTFVNESESSIIGALAVVNRKAQFQLSHEAVEAVGNCNSSTGPELRQLISQLPEAVRLLERSNTSHRC